MTGAQLLIRRLEREGVRQVFGMPGEETLDLNDALSSIRGFASSWSATTGGSALVDCPVDYAEDDRLAEQ